MTLVELQYPNQYSPTPAQDTCGRFLSPRRDVDYGEYLYHEDLRLLGYEIAQLEECVYFNIALPYGK